MIKFFDTEADVWTRASVDFTTVTYKEIYGLQVPVMPKDELLAYKKKLMRKVDILDVQELEGEA
ncbi:MAG: hypothetical protein ACI9VM_000987 [Candidatus Azotimanducaceae bacterium]